MGNFKNIYITLSERSQILKTPYVTLHKGKLTGYFESRVQWELKANRP